MLVLFWKQITSCPGKEFCPAMNHNSGLTHTHMWFIVGAGRLRVLALSEMVNIFACEET
jgi:hypothetical protein